MYYIVTQCCMRGLANSVIEGKQRFSIIYSIRVCWRISRILCPWEVAKLQIVVHAFFWPCECTTASACSDSEISLSPWKPSSTKLALVSAFSAVRSVSIHWIKVDTPRKLSLSLDKENAEASQFCHVSINMRLRKTKTVPQQYVYLRWFTWILGPSLSTDWNEWLAKYRGLCANKAHLNKLVGLLHLRICFISRTSTCDGRRYFDRRDQCLLSKSWSLCSHNFFSCSFQTASTSTEIHWSNQLRGILEWGHFQSRNKVRICVFHCPCKGFATSGPIWD